MLCCCCGAQQRLNLLQRALPSHPQTCSAACTVPTGHHTHFDAICYGLQDIQAQCTLEVTGSSCNLCACSRMHRRSSPAADRVIVQVLAAQTAFKEELEPLHEFHIVQWPALHQLVHIHRLQSAHGSQSYRQCTL